MRAVWIAVGAGTLSVCLLWLFIVRPFVFHFTPRHPAISSSARELERQVRKLSQEFVPRDWQHAGILDRAAEYLAEEFRRSNSQVSFQYFQAAGRSYRNVISEYRVAGDRPAVIIGAHYDAEGDLPGADDNASGVAGLLELARLLAIHGPKQTTVLAAYALEEMPFFAGHDMGSAVHAAALRQAQQNVRLMIALEMIGYFSDQPDSQSYPLPVLSWLYPARGDFIAIVGTLNLSLATLTLKRALLESTRLPVYSINAPRNLPGVDFSDHRSFWENGYDAVMVTDTAFFRNRAYHTIQDTAERLDYERMAEVVTGVYFYLLGNSQP